MKQIIDELKAVIDGGHYYSALTLALSLPDICSQVAYGLAKGSRSYYIKWINDNMDKTAFSVGIPGFEGIELSGSICYALRCRVLHNTDLEIDKADIVAKENIKVTNFQLVKPGTISGADGKPSGWRYHTCESKKEYNVIIDVQYLCQILYETFLSFYNKSGLKNKLDAACYEIN